MNRLHYFHVIAQTQSLREASEILNISQPALSKSVKTFELEVGEKLIQPQGRGIQLTDKGLELKNNSESLLKQWRSFSQKPFETANPSDVLKLCSFEVFSTHCFGKMVDGSFTNQKIQLHESVPGHMEKLVADRTVDYGITYLPVPHQDLDFLRVCQIRMGIFGTKAFENNKEYLKWPFVIPLTPLEGNPSKVKGLDGWPDDEFPREIKYEVAMMESALNLCRRGLAVAYLPHFVVDLYNEPLGAKHQLKEFFPPKGFKKQSQWVYILKRKTDEESHRVKKIAKELRLMIRSQH